MSMKNQAYNSMCEEEEYDSKIPLHSDEAFQRGIQFKIKVIEKFLIQFKI
jgi:hypothetical protein